MKKVIAILLIVLVCFGMMSCIPLDMDSEELMGTQKETKETEKKDDNSKSQLVYIGETAVNSKGVEFTVQSVKNTNKIGYYGTTENNYIIVTLKISNKGTDTWSQNPNNCVLLLNGVEYVYSSDTFYLENSMSGLDDINPGVTKTFNIAFETPTKSSEDTYSIKLSGYSFFSNDSVTIVLSDRPE